jgi:hypothetical protein
MKFLFVSFLFLVMLVSCKNNKGKDDAANADTTRFPLIDLLNNDVEDVVKTPYFLYQTTTDLGNKKLKDSTTITRDELKKIVEPILKTDITSKKGIKNFNETSFEDLSIKTISVIVKANNENEPVQNITALFDNQKSILKNATITLINNNKDTFCTKKIFWKVGKSINIATTQKLKDSIVKETIQFINWNDNK